MTAAAVPDPRATAPQHALFPLFVDLRDRRVAVVGGGAVARRKVDALRPTGARIRVIAPRLDAALDGLVADGAIEHVRAAFRPDHLDDAWFVIAATDDDAVNAAVATAAEARRLWVNVVDDAAACSAQLPARVERGPLQIAISSGGHAPMLARFLRERFERELDGVWSELATLLAARRADIRRRYPDTAARRAFFDRLLAGAVPARLRAGDADGAQAAFDALLGERPPRPQGRVTLVGAGPGDPGLLTLRALRALNEADVVLHDRLVDPRVLELARRDAEFVDVGKTAGGDHVPQARTHALMRAHAQAGRRVVRLKGGDAFVFGRGGEELEFLRAHGIAFDVVPGITAALACAAYAGIPLTHRDHAQSVRFVTAHSRDDADRLDWTALAAPAQTIAFYMGVSALERVQTQLLRHGAPASRPFAIVEHGSRPQQRVITGTLADLAGTARAFDVRSPALLIVGDVAALARTLHWYGAAPVSMDAAAPQATPMADAA